jgi:hypothetical protein
MIAPASESGTARAAVGGALCAAATRGPEVATGCGTLAELVPGVKGGAPGSTVAGSDEFALPFGGAIGAWSDPD